MKKISFLLVFLLILNFNNNLAHAADLNLDAKAYILIDSKTGQVLAEANADKKLRPASTTKIMTAILAIENGDMNQMMTASKAAVYDIGPGGMNIGIMPGEEMRLGDLLSALLIVSANETANIIAENMAPSRQAFIDMMNSKAIELGALNTFFVNPCGKDNSKEDANHLTTAKDLAIIARYAMTKQEFRAYVGKEYLNDLSPTNKHTKWNTLRTTNKLIWGNRDYSYTDNGEKKSYTVVGLKTGYTDAAGHNFVSAATNDKGVELIAVVLGAKSTVSDQVFTYSKELLEYGFKNYSLQNYIEEGTIIKTVNVGNDILDLVTASTLNTLLPLSADSWNITSSEHINEDLTAPIDKGTVVGYIDYERNGVKLGTVEVITSKSIAEEKKAEDLVKKSNVILNIFLRALVLFAFFITLRKSLRKISKYLKNKKRNIC